MKMLNLLLGIVSKPPPRVSSKGFAVRTSIRAGAGFIGNNPGIGYVPLSRAAAKLLDAQARHAGRLYARLRGL